MMFFNKKGQSALEFLMTYGWAFLVALIVIGGLAYFGVLDPTAMLPDRCTFGAGEINCDAAKIDVSNEAGDGIPVDTGYILVKMTNALGKTVKIIDIKVYNDRLERLCTDSNDIINGIGNTEFEFDGVSYTGATNNIFDEDGTGTQADSYTWLEGRPVTFKFTGCEFGSTSVQANKKTKFFVDVKLYVLQEGYAFSKTIRGEIFQKTEG